MGKTNDRVAFETTLITTDNKPIYHYLLVEKEWVAPLGFTGNTRRVLCTMNGKVTIQCSLMPSGKGPYYISLNKDTRTRLAIVPGDTLKVELVRDESKYGWPMPEELQEVLNQDPEGDRLFHKLTSGKQRTLLYFVSKPKDIDRRIDAALVILLHLKNNDGKIDYRKLYHELKGPGSQAGLDVTIDD